MAKKAKPIPDGYGTVTPHLVVREAAKALEFYQKAFGAQERCRMPGPGGKLMHAEFQIGNSIIMMVDEMPEFNKSPQALGGSPVTIHLYVEDVDVLFDRAVKAGATATMPVSDTFWGDRYGRLSDPFGHQWSIATHKQDLTPEEIQKGAEEYFAKAGKQ